MLLRDKIARAIHKDGIEKAIKKRDSFVPVFKDVKKG
jgi:hypothetical protein